jgi:hypothetical protein
MKRRVLVACLSLMAAPALACTSMPDHWRDDPQTMVARTPTIVLAKVASIREGMVQLESVKAVRGKPARTFSVRGWADKKNRGDFSGHKDPRFWALEVSNTVWPGDCSAYGEFIVGEMYLVFLDGPNYPRSFENIRSEDDLWYQTIARAVDALRAKGAR